MTFACCTTSNNETRWINMDLVTRFSLCHDAVDDCRVLVASFASGDQVTIHGGNETDEFAIDQLLALVVTETAQAAAAA